MNPLAIVGAAVAAAVGAGIWAAITASTGYEIGYVAWGIGGLVGFAAYALKGRGTSAGITAAAFALLSIAGGKIIANDILIGKEFSTQVTSEGYEELMSDAKAYPGTDDRQALRAFITDRGFVELPLEESDVDEFIEAWDGKLTQWKTDAPTFETWQKGTVSEMKEYVYAEQSRFEIMKSDLGPIDLLFAFLGLATAFKIVAREEEEITSQPQPEEEGEDTPTV